MFVISDQAANYVDVADKTILVIGTQDPWLEAVLLTKKPKKVVTVEYGYFIRLEKLDKPLDFHSPKHT